MSDHILESLFLDLSIWKEVLEWGVRKGIRQSDLSYIQDPHGRAELCRKIYMEEYIIEPPRTGYAKKEDGGERTFFINDSLTRLIFHAIYIWLMKHEGNMIHPTCVSYHQGIGIGKIVKHVSQQIQELKLRSESGVVGRKFDIHHYFDSIPRRFIHKALDQVEQHYGPSSVITLIRNYYDTDLYYDSRKKTHVEAYQGIKQGCAVSSWFANTMLYQIDEKMAALGGCYVRYSDDILFVGDNYKQATTLLKEELGKFSLCLNEDKQEDVRFDRFVRFLGFDIRGSEITLSRKWVKAFQDNIDKLTIHNQPILKKVRNIRKTRSVKSEEQIRHLTDSVMKRMARFLYWGNGKYTWGTTILSIINRTEDIHQLNAYCLDALRAVHTGKTNIGGLGKSKQGGITRGKGRDVAYNRRNTEKWLPSFTSLYAMWKVTHNKWLYRALVNDLLLPTQQSYQQQEPLEDVTIEALNSLYTQHLTSEPDGKELTRFYAQPIDDLDIDDLLCAEPRSMSNEKLEAYIRSFGSFNHLSGNEKDWFWQSSERPELVVLRKWWDED